ncbi:prolyl oligopeptidase family serine peptidase [Granulosicoccaceae sp. 1_MG-2023]|nr:prolyl oligopeptidase family serine peptidase [Granulosicoccaceae sp. 1_MG-2023]
MLSPRFAQRIVAFSLLLIALLLLAVVLSRREDAAPVWPDGFSRISLAHSGITEPAWYFAPASNEPQPLLVSLHSWSGDADQHDPLAAAAKQAGWHYIHPDFGGANTHPGACLSRTALAGIDAAIDYALSNGKADPARIFVTGESGGGYAALGTWLQSRYKLAGAMAWVPISDLQAWHEESQHRPPPDPERRQGYDADIRACTGSSDTLDTSAARERSPLWMTARGINQETPLMLLAGIHDGHDGAAVPVSHSVHFFNRIAAERGDSAAIVSPATLDALLQRQPLTVSGTVGGRDIYLQRHTGPHSLVIFEGGHESLPGYTLQRLQELAAE